MINVNYKGFKFYQETQKFIRDIYKVTTRFPDGEKFGLISQLRRASVSISSNIAEGSGRSTYKDFRNFLHIALGSAKEVESQIETSKNLKYISLNDYNKLQETLDFIIGSITIYIKKIE